MENSIDSRIIQFIEEHHVLTLATSCDNTPYCCACFYVYLKNENLFIFTSDMKTKHVIEMMKNPNVAAGITLETKTIGKIRGLQISGRIMELKGDVLSLANKTYLKKFPYALLKKTTMWGLQPNFMKHTDNRLGFGKKTIWHTDT